MRVSVLETTKAAGPLAKQAELVTAMQKLKEKEIGCRWDAGGAGLGRSGGLFWWMSWSCRKWKSQYKSRPNMWEMGIWMDLDGFGGSSEG